MTNKKNLKLDLMKLGNRLVTDYGHDPAIGEGDSFLHAMNTFVTALNESPEEVRMVLHELGYEWPTVFKGVTGWTESEPSDDPSSPEYEDRYGIGWN